jgi:thiamine pyrophosphate-dependent acetolactate synthase large subunit-like protein
MDLNGGSLLAETLAKVAPVVFTLHGGHLDSFFHGCRDSGIDLLDFRHEAAAVNAADARIVHADADPAEIGRLAPVDVAPGRRLRADAELSAGRHQRGALARPRRLGGAGGRGPSPGRGAVR